MRICCYGASSAEIDSIYLETAFQVGSRIAKENFGLIFGAGKYGVMGNLALGALSENGEVIGIVPEFFIPDGVVFEECTEIIYTKSMRERKQKMAEMADAFFVLPGGIGTLEEYYETLTAYQLGMHYKPMVLLNINGYYDKLEEFMKHTVEEKFLKQEAKDLVFVTDSIDEAIRYVTENQNKVSGDIKDYKYIVEE